MEEATRRVWGIVEVVHLGAMACHFAIQLVLMGGCGGRVNPAVADQDEVSTGVPQSGIYHLTVENISDDCSLPALTRDSGDVIVVVGVALPSGRIWVSIPLGAGGQRQDISTDSPLDESFNPRPACPSIEEHFVVMLTSVSNLEIEASWSISYTGMQGCAPMAGVPSSDCSWETRLTYRWVRECSNPNHLICD